MYHCGSLYPFVMGVHRINDLTLIYMFKVLYKVTSFSVAVAVEKQRRFFVHNLMLGVQLATWQVVHRALSCPQRIFVISLRCCMSAMATQH